MRKVSIFGVALLLSLASDAALSVPGQAFELDRYFAKLEQLAREKGEIPLQQSGRDKFPQEITKSQNLAEAGMYRDAGAVLSALLKEEMAADWKAMLTTRVEILQKWADTQTIELSDYRRFYLDTGPQWFRGRAKPIVMLWKLNGVDEGQKYALLRDLLRKRGDSKGERLVLKAIASSKNSSHDEAASALLEIANQHYRAKDYDQAETLWIQARDRFPDSAAWGKAVFNLGILHKEKGDFPRAIEWFSSLLDAKVNDLEPGSHIMEAYRNYRPRAQWEIGNCLFAQRKYGEALGAYRRTETTYPFQSWCGNAHAEHRHRYAFHQGLCHDWLGDQRTAVKLYYKAIRRSFGLYDNSIGHIRIVDLYEAAGQSNDLQRLLTSIDKQHLAETKRHLRGKEQRSDDQILKWCHSQTMRRILAIRSMEAEKNWNGLISLLRIKGTTAGPDEAHARRRNWEATEAARLLAKHSKETVPLIIARLADADHQNVKWLYYALGRCGGEKAVQTLKACALRETNCWWTNAVVYALSLAGETGDGALKELAKLADGNLKGSILRYRQGKIGDRDEDVSFPELRDIPTLPRTLEEMEIAQPGAEGDAVNRAP